MSNFRESRSCLQISQSLYVELMPDLYFIVAGTSFCSTRVSVLQAGNKFLAKLFKAVKVTFI